jgi:hypothetical protein
MAGAGWNPGASIIHPGSGFSSDKPWIKGSNQGEKHCITGAILFYFSSEMANTINIPRSHLIMAMCLPLSVLLGYFLAEPLDSGSMAVVIVVLAVLLVPLMMKWHHPLLVLSWNAVITPSLLPGQPAIWMAMAPASLLFAMLNRSVKPQQKFLFVRSMATPLIFLSAVVMFTAMAVGGIGLRSLGSTHYGARGYFYIMVAILGYFALTSQRIPQNKLGLYVAMFFLPGITGIIPNLAYSAGPSFYFLFNFFPAGNAMEQVMGEGSLGNPIVRLNGLSHAGPAIYCFLLARYGIRGIFDSTKLWRGLLFLIAVAACVASGFRSVLVLFVLTFATLFYFEGLHRTRFLPVLLGIVLAGAALVLPFAEKLPLVVQRTLSFLPAKVDPLVERATSDSTIWRMELWKLVLPDVPKYFFKGKGYNMDPNEMYMAMEATRRHDDKPYSTALVAGDYHNGPLSVIIPLGIFGVIAFVWFWIASVRVLYRNHRSSPPELARVNAFLLAAFVAKIPFFIFVFGSLYSDLSTFIGLIGLSVSLNGVPEAQTEEEPAEEAIEAFS